MQPPKKGIKKKMQWFRAAVQNRISRVSAQRPARAGPGDARERRLEAIVLQLVESGAGRESPGEARERRFEAIVLQIRKKSNILTKKLAKRDEFY